MSQLCPAPARVFVSQAPACAFCKRNRESSEMYSSHQLKDASGRVTCPMLRKYVCAGCGGTGDNAHTRSYCPVVVSARQQRQAASAAAAAAALVTANPAVQQLQQYRQPARDAPPSADIELGSNRAFNNMSRVTNSLYNSAGRLRNRSARQYQAQAQSGQHKQQDHERQPSPADYEENEQNRPVWNPYGTNYYHP